LQQPGRTCHDRTRGLVKTRHSLIAGLALVSIAAHVGLILAAPPSWSILGRRVADWPLILTLAAGGLPLVVELLGRLVRREFGSDLLAGLSIVTAALLGQYLAGAIVVLMLSGGEALEQFAVRRASSVLDALARRMPTRAHRREPGGSVDIALDDVRVGDLLDVHPHDICPVDGHVVEGHGAMDESYLTGEPFVIAKTPGSEVLSGAINGDAVLTIRADRPAGDSRYARIMRVMQESEQRRPRLRRLGDRLGAVYTPIAVAIAGAAWMATGSPTRFLSVLVVATPCPLLIAIPVAIIGSISLAARRGIIVRDPTALERLDTCRVMILDKTGTLTYGEPQLTEVVPAPDWTRNAVLGLVGSLERYSKHPLAHAVLTAADAAQLAKLPVTAVSERPGEGLIGVVGGRRVCVTSRGRYLASVTGPPPPLPPVAAGMECLVVVDDAYAATCRFSDEPRRDSGHFVRHLGPRHQFTRVLIVSGDRDAEVRDLAARVGVTEVYSGQTPEQKLALVREATRQAPTVFLGDGINDAPGLTAATVGVAFGQHSDITSEAAGVVVMDSSLDAVDELLHIGRRMRRVALQSAIGGMALSSVGMVAAAGGWLLPVAGALAQELIDVVAVANALRAGWAPARLADYGGDPGTTGTGGAPGAAAAGRDRGRPVRTRDSLGSADPSRG